MTFLTQSTAPAEMTAARGHTHIMSWPLTHCIQRLQRRRPSASASVQAHLQNLSMLCQNTYHKHKALLEGCMQRTAAAGSSNVSSSNSYMPETNSASAWSTLTSRAGAKQDHRAGAKQEHRARLAKIGLTLTKLRAETGLCRLPPSAWPPVSSVVGMCSVRLASSVKTCTVPLSLETATYSGMGPREKAMLKIVAGSAPLLNSCNTMQGMPHFAFLSWHSRWE